jgi:hypothetical protein
MPYISVAKKFLFLEIEHVVTAVVTNLASADLSVSRNDTGGERFSLPCRAGRGTVSMAGCKAFEYLLKSSAGNTKNRFRLSGGLGGFVSGYLIGLKIAPPPHLQILEISPLFRLRNLSDRATQAHDFSSD